MTTSASSRPEGFDAVETAAVQAEEGAEITYRAQGVRAGVRWAVASGRAVDGLTYARVEAAGRQQATFTLSYPKELKLLYAPIILKMNQCLKLDHFSY